MELIALKDVCRAARIQPKKARRILRNTGAVPANGRWFLTPEMARQAVQLLLVARG